MKIWMDGTVVDPEQARISVLDHGLLYGDGVFEGIGVTDGRVVDLELHLERLERSARAIHLGLPRSRAELSGIVLDTVAANGKPEAYVRLVTTRGQGLLGLDVETCAEPRVICIVDGIALYSPEGRARGLSLATASLRRPDADVLDPSVKSLNYLNNVINKLQAKRRGADEALVLNRQGHVAEASGANLFVRFGRRLETPPVSDGALPGITRRRVMQLAPGLGFEVRERSLSRGDVLSADEAFLTGTGAGLVKVRELDGEALGADGGEAVLDALRAAFADYAREHGEPVVGLGHRAA